MGKSLRDSLSQLVSSDTFDNPYDDNDQDDKIRIDDFIDEYEEYHKSRPAKKKKDEFEKVIERTASLRQAMSIDELAETFESYLEDFIVEDEDVELQRELVKRGRLYTRDTTVSKESSEIEKLYAGNQQRIEKLLTEVEEDNQALQKDITHMRMSRSRNYKSLAEMVGERRSLHDTTLSAIKELNNMNKTRIELQMKADKAKQDAGGESDAMANRALQSLFGMGRDALVGSYEEMSGANEAGIDHSDDYIDEDEIIHKKYFNDEEDREETDGDKFIKYEGMGVHYILEYDDDGPVQIVAEDRNGNVIPDYPTPDLKELNFKISENTGTATDNLAQKYDLRRV